MPIQLNPRYFIAALSLMAWPCTAQEASSGVGVVTSHGQGLHGYYMSPPTRGKLVSIDPALLVTPPAGLEVGYVPIVTRQEMKAMVSPNDPNAARKN